MDPEQPNTDEQLTQLRKARALCLQDDFFWPRILEKVLPIMKSAPELRRWGAEFLAETFSTPTVDDTRKTNMALEALDTLVDIIQEREAELLKHAVQSSASIYPLLFRHICANPKKTEEWQKISIIKQKILWLWDSGPPGVKVCCIKFVQRVIQVQTPGVTDPRLVNKAEISLAAVPLGHPLLPISTLEAEAQGLLDRLLSVFHDEPQDPLLMTSTLNCLSVLIKTRSSISAKILSAVLSFNPLSAAMKTPTLQNKLMAKCIEKTVRVLLLNLIRTNPTSPYVQRITQHLHRLNQAKTELLDDTSRKRPALAPPVSQTPDSAKRQKFDSNAIQSASQPFTGPPTYANLFTLTRDAALTSFDVQQLPLDIVIQITLATFYSINQQALDVAVQTVRDRYNFLCTRPVITQQSQPVQPAGLPLHPQAISQTQVLGPQGGLQTTTPPDSPPKHDAQPVPVFEVSKPKETDDVEEDEDMEDEYPIGSYKLPLPTPPTDEQRIEAACASVDRMFSVLEHLDKTPLVQRKNKGGLMRVAASTWDRDGWITLIVRLATRGLGACDVEVKGDDGRIQRVPSPVAQYVRERLLAYAIADFRQNLDSAVTWLYEEWYNDSVMRSLPMGESRVRQYPIWMMKVVDGILPFVEAKDRLVIRFLSEVPELSREIINKVKILCLDPDRASLGIQILHYNAMLRPPVREMCLDLFEDFYHNHKELSSMTVKFLRKWRPIALEASPPVKKEEPHDDGTNGVKTELSDSPSSSATQGVVQTTDNASS
ncbi:hypothetical protein BDZ91DRAFT_782414 [Kalaharituber pfeilii]|nr:hypothetical protein BDZ91DRAFT_782414 [Kalaharituber pfeilii]